MTNIDVFNRIVAEVFKELYGAFPKPVFLLARDIRAKAGIPDADWWESSGGVSGNSAGCAIIWLRAEGFIRFSDQAGDGAQFADVILTSKGFAALNKSPKSLETKPTVGHRLKELSKTATEEAVAGLVGIALGALTQA